MKVEKSERIWQEFVEINKMFEETAHFCCKYLTKERY